MISPDLRDRAIILAIGLLVLLSPVLFLAATLSFLILTGDLILGQVTLLEFLELYIIELILFIGLTYGLYKLTLWMVENQLPASLDAIEGRDAEEILNDDSVDTRDSSNDRK